MDFGWNTISSVADRTYGSASDRNASALENKLNGGMESATDEELMDVCKEFEAYFVEQVLKEMEKTIPKNEDEDSSTSMLTDYYKDEMIKTLAEGVCEQQSLGLAQQMYEQMKRNYSL